MERLLRRVRQEAAQGDGAVVAAPRPIPAGASLVLPLPKVVLPLGLRQRQPRGYRLRSRTSVRNPGRIRQCFGERRLVLPICSCKWSYLFANGGENDRWQRSARLREVARGMRLVLAPAAVAFEAAPGGVPPWYRIAAAGLIAATAAGCGAAADSGSVSDELTSRYGIDYAWGRPAPVTICADGYAFAARYLSYDTPRARTSAPARRTRCAPPASTWSSCGSRRDPRARRLRHRRQRRARGGAPGRRLRHAGGPPDLFRRRLRRAAGPTRRHRLLLRRRRVGPRARSHRRLRRHRRGQPAVRRRQGRLRLADLRVVGGRWDGRAQLRQILNGINVGGVDSDCDVAAASDFGQWGWAPPPPPREIRTSRWGRTPTGDSR